MQITEGYIVRQSPLLKGGPESSKSSRWHTSSLLTLIGIGLKQRLWNRLIQPLAGLTLTVGLAIACMPSALAQDASVTLSPASQAATVSDSTTATDTFPANGVYLYGQAPEPGQLGMAYAVMEVSDRQTIGAFYMPYSSFDCFYGDVEPDRLDLTVVSSYEDTTYAYSLPLSQTTAVADASGSSAKAPVQLENYYPIDTVSDMDRQMLATCRANHGNEI